MRTWGLFARGKTEEHENMGIACGDKTEEHGDCLRGIRQENMRTWGLFARGKTGEQKNMFFG